MNLNKEEVLELFKKCGAMSANGIFFQVSDQEILKFAAALEAKILAGLKVDAEPVGYVDYDQPNNIAWCTHANGLEDITPLYPASALIAARLQGRDEQREIDAQICDAQGLEWDSDNVVTEKNYAAYCAEAICNQPTGDDTRTARETGTDKERHHGY